MRLQGAKERGRWEIGLRKQVRKKILEKGKTGGVRGRKTDIHKHIKVVG